MADVAHLRIQNLIPTAARRLISIYFRYHTLLKKKVFWNTFFFFFSFSGLNPGYLAKPLKAEFQLEVPNTQL